MRIALNLPDRETALQVPPATVRRLHAMDVLEGVALGHRDTGVPIEEGLRAARARSLLRAWGWL